MPTEALPQPKAAEVVFEGVTKRFGATLAVDNVSLRIPAGRLVTLLGPSGCGKTTVLRLVAGLEFANAGRIVIGGRDVSRLSASMRGVSMVFQNYALFPHMTVAQNIAYGPLAEGRPRQEAHARAAAVMEQLGLGGLGDRLPSALSGGQQQRVAVARALVLRPGVLLFDEPLSNLDARLRRQVRDDIRALQQRLGLTVLYVTHDQQEALAVSDEVIVMSNARIAQTGAPRTLYEQPASRFIADFIGEANLFDATVLAVADGMAEVEAGPWRVRLPARAIRPGAATLAVRPHGWVLSRQPRADALAARLIGQAFVGSHVEATFATAIGEVFAILSADTAIDPAAETFLTLAASPGATAVIAGGDAVRSPARLRR